jgi:hypothetical protein
MFLRWSRSTFPALLTWIVLGANYPALAGSSYAELKWNHENPANLLKFNVLMASEEGDVSGAEVIDVGLPVRDGIYRWSIRIPENEFIWVCVVAVGRAQLESEPSAWRRLSWDSTQSQLTMPGKPFLVDQPDPLAQAPK